MDKLFRQVSVKERLPEKDGMVVCISSDGQPFITLYDVGISISSSAAFWLEEVELPSDEDIDKATVQYDTFNHSDTISEAFENGANYILNTLKGG